MNLQEQINNLYNPVNKLSLDNYHETVTTMR